MLPRPLRSAHARADQHSLDLLVAIDVGMARQDEGASDSNDAAIARRDGTAAHGSAGDEP